MAKVNIQGLKKEDVLAALFNHSKFQGFNFGMTAPILTSSEAKIDLENAERRDPEVYFDYYRGKVMKVSLASDIEFESWGYDRDNGQGAAQRAVDSLRS